MAAILEVAKFSLNALPNIECITLLVIVFTHHFGYRMTLPAVLIFAFLECTWWGFGTWSIVYFYMWPILVLLTTLLVRDDEMLMPIVLSTIYGLGFGAMSAILTLVIGGWQAALAWWIAGIPYDIVHGIGNMLIALTLYKPLCNALSRIA